MPDTYFTAAPHWTWYIVAYFFIGGIAGTGFVLAALLQFFGRPEDRPLVRIGYYVAVVGALLSGLLLIIDLNRPDRFWHMMIESNTGRPMFKPWVPMSVGVWGVLFFGLFSSLAALSVLGEDRPGWKFTRWAPVRALGGGLPAALIAAPGALFGLFLAGYTGVLLSVTNRPLWADSNLVGLLFLVSGFSTGAAALYLLARRRRVGHPNSMAWLTWLDQRVLLVELVVLIAFLVSLGPVIEILVGWWGVLLLLGVVGLGILVPLWLARGVHAGGRAAQAAVLVLVGGFLLRVVVILSSHEVHVYGSGVALP